MALGVAPCSAFANQAPSPKSTPALGTARPTLGYTSTPPIKPPATGMATTSLRAAPPGARPSTPSNKKPGGKGEEPPQAQVKKARDLWYRGVEAFRNGNYEAARLAFSECYQLMPKSDVLRNLSISEIQSGHYVSAARHLTQLLAAPGDLPNNVREEATSRLAQAEAQIGQLKIVVDVSGAEIAVDGTVVGRSPLEGSWYIEPGQHDVTISKAGYPAEARQIFALAGVSIPVDVSLETLRREQAADAKAALLMGTSEGQAPLRPGDSDGVSTASTVALVTTSTLAAAGLAAGIVFTLSANSHDSNAEGMSDRLVGGPPCDAGTLLPEECAILRREREDSDTDRRRALVGFIGFGVASAATLGYALWLAVDGEEAESHTATTGIQPSLSIGRGAASVHLHARF